MNKHKPLGILFLLLGITLSVTASAVGVYALFSDQVTVASHLQAGKLDATLTRTSCSYKILDDTGHLETTTDENPVDMESESVTNAFGLPANALIVPQSVLQASFKLSNDGNVAFKYSVKILLTDDQNQQINKEDANELASQIKVTFNESTSYLVEGSFDGTGFKIDGDSCKLDAGANTTFSVVLEFIDSNGTGIDFINNDAMEQTVYFDIVVEAVQIVD